jgi:hypothetical protein
MTGVIACDFSPSTLADQISVPAHREDGYTMQTAALRR